MVIYGHAYGYGLGIGTFPVFIGKTHPNFSKFKTFSVGSR